MDCKKETFGIYSKLAGVRSELDGMQKAGENEQQGYSYFSDDQISGTFRKLFNVHKIAFIYSSEITGCREISTTRSGTRQFITDVSVHYFFVDIEDGSKVEGYACGSGNDTGDKGVYKAITGAVKYIFMKTFQISTGDDPEKDNVKEWTPKEAKKTDKKENKDPLEFGGTDGFDPEIFKQDFTQNDFENFKKAVETGAFDIKDKTASEVIEKISEKYNIGSKFKLEIQGFMKCQK